MPGKHGCYGDCKSDSRYWDKAPGVLFWPFPKPKTNLPKCLTWIITCRRPTLSAECRSDCEAHVCQLQGMNVIVLHTSYRLRLVFDTACDIFDSVIGDCSHPETELHGNWSVFLAWWMQVLRVLCWQLFISAFALSGILRGLRWIATKTLTLEVLRKICGNSGDLALDGYTWQYCVRIYLSE